LPNGALFRWQFEKGGPTTLIDASGPITLDEASLARTAVLDGIGLGYFFEQDVRADIEAGRLIRVLEDWMTPVPLPLLSRAAQPLGGTEGPHQVGPGTQRKTIVVITCDHA
jgi:DNA-binding transcriptional LysR family regulator